MDTVICLLPFIPIRREPSHRSEQTSQLIFGEKADVKDEKDNWIEIKTRFDSYSGWIEKNSVEIANDDLLTQKTIITTEPVTICEKENEKLYLTAGSEIMDPDANGIFKYKESTYKLIDNLPIQRKFSSSGIIETAGKFLNSPYLWGGRSVFGMDCSGFVQIVFKIHGRNLPRDAKDQANAGEAVNSFRDIEAGDLVFFDNPEGKITHVGIVLGEKLIIHASVFVRIDKLDERGIFNLKRKEYTHSLKNIRRVR
jgi:gamma-D-glutamyl-L-lysine dipeptidyl-peptidase